MSIENVIIACYSGTGGTKMAAACLEESFRAKGANAVTVTTSSGAAPQPEDDLLVVIYPVHAMNAPEGVYKWIDGLPEARGKRAAVISVSGGGEICPNTASRVGCIKRLEKKGYVVTYETMLVMPSNVAAPTAEALAVKLIEALPRRAEAAASGMLAGEVRRTKPLLFDRFLRVVCEVEKTGAHFAGKRIKCSDKCNGCGWCVKNCPAGNIELKEGRPVFGARCNICLGCLYGCPLKALDPGPIGFLMNKQGFSLEDLARKAPWPGPVDVEKLARGYFWSGVRDYLLEDEASRR